MIYDAQNVPVQSVIIKVDGEIIAQSDIEGRLLLPSLARGEHVVLAEKNQYEPVSYRLNFLNRTQVLHLSMTSDRNLIQGIEGALSGGDLENAAGQLERLLAIKPGDPEVLFLEAIIHYRKGNIKEARYTAFLLISPPSFSPVSGTECPDVSRSHSEAHSPATIEHQYFLLPKDSCMFPLIQRPLHPDIRGSKSRRFKLRRDAISQ